MLNGVEPILIFQFSKLSPGLQQSISEIPIVSDLVTKIGLPPIPIYLSERLTGIMVDDESKNIDIETTTETLSNGEEPDTKQKGIGSTVRINMRAEKSSIGLMLLGAVCDLVLPKVTSEEYSITYLNGATTLFGGLMRSFSVTKGAGDTTMMDITLELTKTTTKTEEKPGPPEVTPVNEAASLNDGFTPTQTLSPPLQGPPPQPPSPPPIVISPAG